MVYYFNFVYPASMKTDCLSWTAPATPRFGKLKKTRSSENGILSPCFPQHQACFSVMSGSTPNQLALHIPIFFWWRVLAIGNCWALHLRFPIWAGVLHLQTCSFRLGPTGKGSGKHQRWAISATESIHQQKWTFHTRRKYKLVCHFTMKTCGLNQQEVRLESVAVDDRTSEHVYYGGYSLFHLWCKMVQELDNSWVYTVYQYMVTECNWYFVLQDV